MIRRLLWKETFEYEHPNENETVVLMRNRITGGTRRVWYKTHSVFD